MGAEASPFVCLGARSIYTAHEEQAQVTVVVIREALVTVTAVAITASGTAILPSVLPVQSV